MSKKMIADIYPLSPLQEGILYHYLAEPGTEQYVEQTYIKVRGTVDIEKFEAAWNRLIATHEVLRTVFRWEGVERPVQIVLTGRQLKVQMLDLTNFDPAEQEARISEFRAADRKEGFDLAKGPLMRVTLCQLTPETFVLIWSFHHIILDGWSVGVIWKELFQTYQSLSDTGLPYAGESKHFRYRQYIQFLESQEQDEVRTYWQKYLQALTTPTSIPGELKGESTSVVEDRLTIGRELTQKLQEFAQSQRVTVNLLLQLAWGLLLQRYNSTDDALFGVTVSGRPPQLPGVQEGVGLFINTVPVRIKTSKGVTVAEALNTLLQESFQRHKYEYMALSEIKSLSEIPPQQQFFDNIVIFENYPLDQSLKSVTIGGMEILEASMFEMTNFNLALTAILSDQLKFTFSYNPAQYRSETIRQVQNSLLQLLEQITANPNALLAELEMLRPEEKAHILKISAGPRQELSANRLIQHFIAEQAEERPEEVAVIFGEQKLTYSEINKRANQMAAELQSLGVGTETLVGVMLERSAELVVGLLAILKAGGAYLPLDPKFPVERVRYMLDDSRAQVLVINQQFQGLVPDNFAGQVLVIEEMGRTSTVLPSEINASATTLAYVIYTSGSTGQPKGTMIEHRSVVNFIQSFQERLPFKAQKRFLALTTIAFDISVLEIFLTLASGLQVVIAPSEVQRDPVLLNQLMEDAEVDMVQMTPSTLQMLVNVGFSSAKRLTQLYLGGEALPLNLLQWLKTNTNAQIFNLYGPTETTIWSTCRDLTTDEIVTLGEPIDNTSLYILDHAGRLLPTGLVGELWIAGDGLARGYLNRPELTLERFVSDPFYTGQRMYCTGDMVRRLPDGRLEYHGRKDQQVKVRGFRIEVGEIEVRLNSHPAVRESVVVVKDDLMGDKYLVGYAVLKESRSCAVLRSYLAEALPEYMIPAFIIPLESLPLTPNGKIDRKALPEPMGQIRVERHFIPPHTESEVQVAQIWSEVLGVEQGKIGLYDNFFELGGHSLKVTRVLARIHKAFGVQLPVQTFFNNPTIKGIAEVLSGEEKAEYHEIPALQKGNNYPLTHAQQRLWILDRFEKNLAVYNMPAAYLLRGELNVNALKDAFATIVKRHEILRTGFTLEAGKPVQFVDYEYQLLIPYEDLTQGHSSWLKENQHELETILTTEAHKPFDLSKPGLMRVNLYKLEESIHLILITMHHIISDEWSVHLLISEVSRLYEAFSRGKENPLPELRIQYRDYAAYERANFQSSEMQKLEKYWLKTLEGELPILNLPTDYPRPAVKSYRGDLMEFALTKELTQELEHLAHAQGGTLFMALLTAFYIMLYRSGGNKDLIVGIPVSGRTDAELEELIGFFVNTIPFRLQLTGGESFTQLFHKVKDLTLEGFAHQNYPLDRVVDSLAIQRDLSRNPLFEAMFSLVRVNENDSPDGSRHSFEGAGVQSIEGLTFEAVKQEYKISKFDLTLAVFQTEEQIYCGFEYCTDLFKPATIEKMCAQYEVLLTSIAENPEEGITMLNMEPAKDQKRDATDLNPNPVIEGEEEIREYIAPRTPLEAKLAEAWKEILQRDEVSVMDSFFILGGNSLGMIQLHDLLKISIDLPFTVADLFSYHTIAMFAEHLENLEKNGVTADVVVDEAEDQSKVQSLHIPEQVSMVQASPLPTSEVAAAESADDPLNDLLQKLANGELSPEEAANLFTGGR